MNLKLLASAAAVALAPVFAHAASVTPDVSISGTTTSFDYGVLEGSNFTADPDYISDTPLELSSNTFFAFEFEATGESGSLTQVVTNTIDSFWSIFGKGETQLTVAGSSGASYDLFIDGSLLATVGDGATDDFAFKLDAGESLELKWVWGGLVETPGAGGTGQVSTNVVTAVPVPAGILLMGTALAGFGVMRRRKKAA